MEYWGCVGSSAGVMTSFPSLIYACSIFPESNSELTVSVV